MPLDCCVLYCQIRDPPVSVYKGCSMPKDTDNYLQTHGLKNAMYTIRASDLTDDLFGTLVAWPFQVIYRSIPNSSFHLVHFSVYIGFRVEI